MVNALHSSALIEDGKPVTMGDPAGFVIKGEGRSVYHAGDTEIFSDMALIQRIHRPKIGLIPIGDRFTMGPETAAIACNEFLDLDVIVPIHWGTFDLFRRPADVQVAGQTRPGRDPRAGQAARPVAGRSRALRRPARTAGMPGAVAGLERDRAALTGCDGPYVLIPKVSQG